jgi:hypothetical protein
MSKRNTLEQKKLRRLRRTIRKGVSVPRKVDVVDWLKRNGHANSTGQAVKLLVDGKVKIDSHPVRTRLIPAEDATALTVSK